MGRVRLRGRGVPAEGATGASFTRLREHTRRFSSLHGSDASRLPCVFLGMTFKCPGLREHRRCDRGQSVLPACVSLPGLSSSFPALLSFVPAFPGRTAGRRHTGAPPTVPQQRCFLLSFSARGMRLRGDGHAPGYRSMFKALFKSQDLM